jgi:uncharacterized protein (DUF1015 family)
VAEIKPFCGFRYAVDKPDDLSRFIAPPYDMIDGPMIESLYARDEHNVVRITQNKKEPADAENRDRHGRAARFLDAWIKDGTLRQDPRPSLYAYAQDFAIRSGDREVSFRRTAVIALVRLVD